MNAKPKLTLAIPTYNRPKYLAQTLEQLLPQVNSEWVLHLHDNHSDKPVAEVHADLLARFGADRVRVFRNQVNVGGSANILRCFEHCDTEWLIVLGDDDHLQQNLVNAALAATEKYPQMVFANFSSTIFTRAAEFTTTGLGEFCQKFDNWSNLLFLPCGLYKVAAVMPYLQFGYQYSLTYCPHIAMLLKSLQEQGGLCYFSNTFTVENYTPPDVFTWSRINTNLMVLLLELIRDRTNQQQFYKRLKFQFIRPFNLAGALIDRAEAGTGDQRVIFEIRSLAYTAMGATLKEKATIALLRLLLVCPPLASKLLQFTRKLRGIKTSKRISKDLLVE